MTKQLAQALFLFYNLQAKNHQPNCACGKTSKGVCMVHYSKTEDEYNEIVSTAES